MKTRHHGLVSALALLWVSPAGAADDSTPPAPSAPPAPTAPVAAPAPDVSEPSGSDEEGESRDDESPEAESPDQGAKPEQSSSESPTSKSAPPSGSDAAAPAAPTSAASSAPQPASSRSAANDARPQSTAKSSEEPSVKVGLGLSPGDDPTRDMKEKDDKKSTDDDEPNEGGYLALDVTSTLGTGTFLSDPNVRNPYVDWAGTVLPGYVFGDGTNVSLRFVVTQELTRSDSTTEQNQLLLADLRPGVVRDIVTFGPIETTLRGEAYAYVPTSLVSRAESLYTALEGRFWVWQPIGEKFRVAYRTAYRKNFHEYTTATVDPEADDGLAKAFAREGGSERVAAAAISTGANNVEHYWSNRLQVGYSPLEELSFDFWYTLGHAWTYDSFPVDELSGEGAQEGRGRRDSSEAVLVASYQYSKTMAFTGGLQTVSTPRQADGQGLRFPFYEFEGTALNLSAFFLSATFTQPFPL